MPYQRVLTWMVYGDIDGILLLIICEPTIVAVLPAAAAAIFLLPAMGS